MDKLKAFGETLGGWLLKSFRGLVCEHKAGGWELSKGAVMSWWLLYTLTEMVADGMLSGEWLFYAWVGTMGYNGLKLTDFGGAIAKMRGKA